jgi:hypothetical protein
MEIIVSKEEITRQRKETFDKDFCPPVCFEIEQHPYWTNGYRVFKTVKVNKFWMKSRKEVYADILFCFNMTEVYRYDKVLYDWVLLYSRQLDMDVLKAWVGASVEAEDEGKLDR